MSQIAQIAESSEGRSVILTRLAVLWRDHMSHFSKGLIIRNMYDSFVPSTLVLATLVEIFTRFSSSLSSYPYLEALHQLRSNADH
jgi:hypothetical protein